LEISQDRALEIAAAISKEYMLAIYMTVSPVIGKAILDADLVGVKDSKNLARLIRAACLAAHRGTLEEVEKISSEANAARLLS
jgi:hypothetical protein